MSHSSPEPLETGSAVIRALLAQPRWAEVGAEILRQASREEDAASFLAGALRRVAVAAGSDYAAVVRAEEGRWVVQVEWGPARTLPGGLLAETLDRAAPCSNDAWAGAPLAERAETSEVLVLAGNAPTATRRASAVAVLAPVLGDALGAVRQRDRRQSELARRVRRLEAIVQIAQQWHGHQDVESLLADMAKAATRLLEADRASIFLWDRPARSLVARPALGVEGGELRVPDDAGVVGQVIRTGRPLRVDAAAEPERIDRQVDARLGYQTRTLLCVPLRGSAGELFGAFELVNKHAGRFTEEDEAALVELAAHASIALENAQDRQRLLGVNRRIADQAAESVRLVGRSPAIEAIRSITRRVADTDLAVLVLGENGTGKEIVAQSIHYLSRRRDKPLVAVNCAAIPDTLAESELFGHEKGAFTDAREARAGKFELADLGTLFLDEIGDLSLAAQAKLLRVIEEKTLVRVGGSTPIRTDARIVAATNQDLAAMVRQKRFREDLYFRLNVVAIEIPPLRDRPEDVVPLAEHFLGEFSRRARRPAPRFSAAALARLQSHAWPGNVRELRNLMERLAYLSTDAEIDAAELAFILSPRGGPEIEPAGGESLAEATARFQIDYIHRAVHLAGGNVSQAADRLGLHRSNLYRKMRQLGMETS
ncbi:MAG: sigma 54-interacting transcriptional regulator [Pirellulales bacterium]|nr:sigma 54-interacting transcriptional regulator [Pirellulales bacterium]